MAWVSTNRIHDVSCVVQKIKDRVFELGHLEAPTSAAEDVQGLAWVSPSRPSVFMVPRKRLNQDIRDAPSFDAVALPRIRLIASLIAIALHLACSIYLIFVGYLHVYLTTGLLVYLSGFAAGHTPRDFKRAAIAYTCIGALHLFQAAITLVSLLRLRISGTRFQAFRLGKIWRRAQQRETESRFIHRIRMRVLQIIQRLGLLDSQGGFTKVFTLQEIIVVASQTFQAYRCCNLISRSWVTFLYVTLVILNCWIIPIMCIYMRNRPPALIRSVILGLDALLNMGSCFVFPLVIFWPYYRAYDADFGGFTRSLLYTSVLQSRLITEMQMIFALSLPDLSSKMLNHIGVFSSLVGATAHLQQRLRSTLVRSLSVKALESKRKSSTNTRALSAKIPGFAIGNQSETPRWVTLLQLFLVVWGAGLFAIYAETLNRTRAPLVGCKAMAHPWLSTRYPCSVFEFNCFQRNVQSPKSTDLVVLNPETLLFLSFTHCPNMKVPAEIQDFPHLLGFLIHNSIIAEWETTSSISATKHAHMTSVSITRCNMSSFPEGLLQPMPPVLSVLLFSHTNLTTLPIDVTRVWKPIRHLAMDYSELLEIPTTIFQLNVISYSFVGNRIPRLSLGAINRHVPLIDLAFNPLQELATTFGPGGTIGILDIEGSNVSRFLFQANVTLVAANGSPYCSLPWSQRTATNVVCSPMDPNVLGRLNMTLLDEDTPLL